MQTQRAAEHDENHVKCNFKNTKTNAHAPSEQPFDVLVKHTIVVGAWNSVTPPALTPSVHSVAVVTASGTYILPTGMGISTTSRSGPGVTSESTLLPMASDSKSIVLPSAIDKTKSVQLPVVEEFELVTCAWCAQEFAEHNGERIPRSLACGHHFCTACLIRNIRQAAKAHDFIRCPNSTCGRVTQVGEPGVSSLGVNFAAVALVRLIKTAGGPRPYPIRVRNMGGVEWTVIVKPDDTLNDLKLRIGQLRSMHAARLLRILVRRGDKSDSELTSLDDEIESQYAPSYAPSWRQPTLQRLGIDRNCTVHVVVQDGEDDDFNGGDVVRSFGSFGTESGDFSGVSVSSCGVFLFVADVDNRCIQMLRAADGSYVRSFACDFVPNLICLSRDGSLLFVTANRGFVRVLRIDDGAVLRTLETYAHGICASADGAHVFVVEGQGYYAKDHCIKKIRITDGEIVQTIVIGVQGGAGDPPASNAPHGLCASPDGEFLFVADEGICCVQVVRVVDGALVRLIQPDAVAVPAFSPRNLCVSPNGQWLFVVRSGGVDVIRLADDAFVFALTARDRANENADQDWCRVECVAVSPHGDRLFVSRSYSPQTRIPKVAHGIVVLSVPPSGQ